MKKIFIYALLLLAVTTSCDDFLNPEQGLVVNQDLIPQDEVELQSISLGLYSIQQDLVDQIVVLGELRGDLLTVTDNADPDLREVNAHQISASNEYASPSKFYELIAAANKVIRILEKMHPEVLDESSVITNYHRMYGEAISMRSWSYFYAVRIFNEIPYIPETLNTIEEINDYVNSPGSYTDSVYINYSPNGIDTDTIYDTTFVYTEKKFLDQDQITRRCIKDIDEKVRAVGVDYSNKDLIDDPTWNISVWNEDAVCALLIQMYLHIDDYDDALDMLNTTFLRLSLESVDDTYIKYALDKKFSYSRWKNIFTSVDGSEHIFNLQFQKTSQSWQQNNLQYYFSVLPPNVYALKPTGKAVQLWESQFMGYSLKTTSTSANGTVVQLTPDQVYTESPGTPGDFYRGYDNSYRYMKNGLPLSDTTVAKMLELKALNYWDEVHDIMNGVDTVVYKYTIGKTNFDKNANFIIYRAATMHLYAAEVETNRAYFKGGIIRDGFLKTENYIYDGNYIGSDDERMGVAGRVGFISREGISVDKDYYYVFDPNTNEIIGYEYINTNLKKKQYLEDIIMDQRARELAFEGERFYDYVRMARRREKAGSNGIQWLAESISESYPADERAIIKARLMDESNWYLPFILK